MIYNCTLFVLFPVSFEMAEWSNFFPDAEDVETSNDEATITDEIFKAKCDGLEPLEILRTSDVKCRVCGVGDFIKEDNQNQNMFNIVHEEYRCNFHNPNTRGGRGCRAGHYHRYFTYEGMRIYYDFALIRVYIHKNHIPNKQTKCIP